MSPGINIVRKNKEHRVCWDGRKKTLRAPRQRVPGMPRAPCQRVPGMPREEDRRKRKYIKMKIFNPCCNLSLCLGYGETRTSVTLMFANSNLLITIHLFKFQLHAVLVLNCITIFFGKHYGKLLYFIQDDFFTQHYRNLPLVSLISIYF